MTSGHVTVKTSANVALVKYWGKADVATNTPATGSISIGLEGLVTTTTISVVESDDVESGQVEPDQDQIAIEGKTNGAAIERARRFLDMTRLRYKHNRFFEISSSNNFPTAAGLASSASGFAALALGVDGILNLGLSKTALSQLARRGSGSAARSIFGGYVEMVVGEDAYAVPIADADSWPLSVIVVVTTEAKKAISSAEGMRLTAETSPYYPVWCETHEKDMQTVRNAIRMRDFQCLADTSEHNCLKMFGTMLTSVPPIVYFNGATLAVLQRIRKLRDGGFPVFFTADAGPQVKAVCLAGYENTLQTEMQAIEGVARTILSRVGGSPVVGGMS